MPRSRRTKVRNMPPNQRKAVMANMSAKHRRWARMSRSQRREAGYLERYPIKVEEAKWFTAGGRRVGRMFLEDEEIRVARGELKSDEYLDVIDPDDGETIVGPAWYKDAAAGDLQAINVCPICHRGMKKGYCMEHGYPGAYGYSWNEKKKRWDKK